MDRLLIGNLTLARKPILLLCTLCGREMVVVNGYYYCAQCEVCIGAIALLDRDGFLDRAFPVILAKREKERR